jgi:hypothetical protein
MGIVKKTLSVLMLVFFVTALAGAASACSSCGHKDCKYEYKCEYKYKYDKYKCGCNEHGYHKYCDNDCGCGYKDHDYKHHDYKHNGYKCDKDCDHDDHGDHDDHDDNGYSEWKH